jgi:small-conductance mechanosensitive channel
MVRRIHSWLSTHQEMIRRPSARCARILAALVLLSASWHARADEPPSVADQTIEFTFTAPPAAPDEIGEVIQRVEAELQALAPTTQPVTTQPSTQPDADPAAQLDGWRTILWDHLQTFRGRLVELRDVSRALQRAAQPEAATRLTEELEARRTKTAEVNRHPIPIWVDDDDIEEVRKEYETHDQRLTALLRTLEQQESLLQTGFRAQRDDLRQRLERAEAARNELNDSFALDLKAAETDVQRELVIVRRRAAAARVVSLITARALVDQQERLTQRESERGRLRREALNAYVATLRQRLTGLHEARSRRSVEWLRRQIDAPDADPTERAYLRLKLLYETTLVVMVQDYDRLNREGFQETALQRYKAALGRERAYWENFLASLDRRKPADILKAYHEVLGELEKARTELRRLLNMLDESVSRQRELEEWQERTRDERLRLEAEFRDLLGDRTDSRAITMLDEVGTILKDLPTQFEQRRELDQAMIARLKEGVSLAGDQVALLDQVRSRVYWTHLRLRGPSYFDASIYSDMLDESGDLHPRQWWPGMRSRLTVVRSHIAAVESSDWLWLALQIAAVAAVGLALQRLCSRRYQRLKTRRRSEPTAPLTFTRRVEYQLVWRGATVLPIFALLFALWISGLVCVPDGPAFGLWQYLLVVLAAVAAIETVARMLFGRSRIRNRILQCTNSVARHYRRWIHVGVVLAAGFLGPAFLLEFLDTAPAAQRMLREWFHVALATAFALFLWKRGAVIGIVPRGVHGPYERAARALRGLYPLLVLLPIVIIVMRVSGYRLLASYIAFGLTVTAALSAAACVIYHLVRDLVVWQVCLAARSRPPREEDETAPREGEPPPEATTILPVVRMGLRAPPPPPTPIELPAAARFILSLLRWALALGVALLALAAWGIRPYEIKAILDVEVWRFADQPVTVWRLGGGLVALLAAILTSRVIRQTLQTRLFPRHPEIDRGAQAAINTLLHYSVILIGIYIGLQTLRIDFTAIAVLMGGLGLGIGLGLQSLIVNFISGLLMLFERHVKVGDVVIVHDKLGEVTKVSMRSTTIRTPDGIHLIIPNGEFINQKVENWTLTGQPLRGLVDIGVAYGSDPRRVREILLEIANAEPRALREPTPDVFFVDFGESSLNFRVAAWFRNPPERWHGMIAIRYAIFERFRQEGIEIPFPQRTLSTLGGPLEVRLADGRSAPQVEPRT